MNRKTWTDEEVTILHFMWGRKDSDEKIGKFLHRDENSIRSKRQKLGLFNHPERAGWKKKLPEIQDVIQDVLPQEVDLNCIFLVLVEIRDLLRDKK